MGDYKIKGTVLLDYIRIIRSNPDRNWDKYLKKEDWEVVNSRVLPSMWYPYGLFFRTGKAVFEEIAAGNLQIAKQFGKANAETLFKGAYKSMLDSILAQGGGVVRFLERYASLSLSLFNFITVNLEEITEKNVKLTIDVEMDATEMLAEPYFNQLAGTVESLVTMSGGKNPKVVFISKYWENDPNTVYDVSWD